MHPLVRRILVHGALVFVGLAAVGWVMTASTEHFFNGTAAATSVTLERGDGPTWAGPARFGLFGFAVFAALEGLAFAKNRAFGKRPGQPS